LTGCAGEPFASILRSMGYRSVEMKRSEFIVSPPAVESRQEPSELAQEPKPPFLAEIPEDGTPAPVDMLSALPEAPPPDAPPLDIPEPDVPADGLCADAPGTDAGAASGAPAATSSEEEKNSEMIVVWRPDRSAFARPGVRDRIQRHRGSAPKSALSGDGPPARQDSAGGSPAAVAARMRNKNRREEQPSSLARQRGRNVAAHPPGSAEGGETVRSHEKHRQTARDRDMPRSHPAPERQPRAKVDPNSPFAKLLELRALLEGQANKRP
jgi:ATP-dependent RNA helicase SUPV3L1/SUV3